MDDKQKTVMVFGVFDLLHDGHRHFLSSARALGNRLVVAIARDNSVQSLKQSPPHHSLADRMKNLAALNLVDEVVAGDETLGSWQVVVNKNPDIVALGYDQNLLGEALKKFIAQHKLPIQCISIEPYIDETLHSSALRKRAEL